MKKHTVRNIFLIIILTIFVFFIALFFIQENAKTSSKVRQLSITVTQTEGLSYESFDSNQLGNHYSGEFYYCGVSNVCLRIGGKQVPLEQAIHDEQITVEHVIGLARSDARNGLCVEKMETELGLTSYFYFYPEFDLKYIHDIYETPSGNHLIQYFAAYSPGTSRNHNMSFYDSEHYPIDKEDWGITLDVLEIDEESITLNCVQNGGQQLGNLEIIEFSLADLNKEIGTVRLAKDKYISIPQNTSSIFTLYWKDLKDELCQGEYVLTIRIKDIYDAEKIHPLMKNYYDVQPYHISFSFP